MKVRTLEGKSVDLTPLQTKIALHCISQEQEHLNVCMDCKYNHPCTDEYYIPLCDTPNGALIPEDFTTRVTTNNYRKLHNLPKKRKGVDYFD